MRQIDSWKADCFNADFNNIADLMAGTITVRQYAAFYKISISETRRRKRAEILEREYPALVKKISMMSYKEAKEEFRSVGRRKNYFERHKEDFFLNAALKEVFGFMHSWEEDDAEIYREINEELGF